jgi:hypothetical protein
MCVYSLKNIAATKPRSDAIGKTSFQASNAALEFGWSRWLIAGQDSGNWSRNDRANDQENAAGDER